MFSACTSRSRSTSTSTSAQGAPEEEVLLAHGVDLGGERVVLHDEAREVGEHLVQRVALGGHALEVRDRLGEHVALTLRALHQHSPPA